MKILIALAVLGVAACAAPSTQVGGTPTALATQPGSPGARPAASPTPVTQAVPGPTPTASQARSAVAAGPRITVPVSPPAAGVLTNVDTEIEFITPLASSEVLREIASSLRSVPGIIELIGDDHSVTVLYDTAQVNPVRIQEAFVQLGYPVKRQTEIMDPGISSD